MFPKEVAETVIPNIDILEKSGKIKRKMLNAVKLAVYISESAVMLPDMKGEIGMSILLVADDSSFNKWCLDVFNYY